MLKSFMTYFQSIALGDISPAHSDPSQVVLKRVLPGSLRDKFSFREELGRKSCGWKSLLFLLFVYSTHKKAAQWGWFRWEGIQYAWKGCFNYSDDVQKSS